MMNLELCGKIWEIVKSPNTNVTIVRNFRIFSLKFCIVNISITHKGYSHDYLKVRSEEI